MNITIALRGLTPLTVEVGKNSVLQRAFPATDVIRMNFWTKINVEIPIFSYITYDGRRYYTMSGSSVRANRTDAFEHNVEFYGYVHWAQRVLVMKDFQVSFPFRGTIAQYAELFQQNMRRVFGFDSDFVYAGSSNRVYEFVFNGQNVYEAAISLAQQSGAELEGFRSTGSSPLTPSIRITDAPLGRRNHISNFLDLRNGLSEYSVSVPTGGYANRVYGYGAARNIDFTTYGNERLVSGSGFANGETPAGFIWETAIVNEDIFPSFIGEVTSKQSTLQFTASAINFNINSFLLTETAKVSFLSGDLAGYDLEITSYDNTNKRITVKQITDDTDRQIPGTGASISTGDKFTLLDISMPQSYIDSAEGVLGFVQQEAANDLSRNVADVSIVVLKKWFEDRSLNLALGDDVNLEVLPSIYGFGRVVQLEHPLSEPLEYRAVISKSRSLARLSRIQIGLDRQGYELRKERKERLLNKYNNR